MTRNKKRYLVVILLAALTLAALLALTGCNERVYYIDVTFYSDMPQTIDDIAIEFYKKNEEPIILTVMPREISAEVVEMPTGKYDVRIIRFGIVEETQIEIFADTQSVSFTLFAKSEIDSQVGVVYSIINKEQFDRIKDFEGADKNINYRLDADIKFENEKADLGEFNGTLDGNGYYLKDITNQSDNQGAGICKVNYGTIKNLKISGTSTKGNENVGTIASINYGGIWDVLVEGGSVVGNNFVGGVCGQDFGNIVNADIAGTLISCEGDNSYYGRIAGVSYTNFNLVSYGMRPKFDGETAIGAEMEPVDMLKTAVSNWLVLEDKAKLVKGEFNINFGRLANAAINMMSSYSGLPGWMQTILKTDLFKTEAMYVDAYAEAKIMYNGVKSAQDLGRVMAIGNAYIKATPLQDLLTAIKPLAAIGGINLDFDLVNNPISGAAYYDNSLDDYLAFTMAKSSTLAYGNQITGDFSDTLYWLNMEKDLTTIIEDVGLTSAITGMFLHYIELIKEYVYLGTIEDMISDNFAPVYKEDSFRHLGGIYMMEFEVEADKLFGDILSTINNQIAATENIVKTEYPHLVDVVGSGTKAVANFKNKKLTLKVEIFDNGNLRAMSLDNIDVDLQLNLSTALRSSIISFAKSDYGIDPTSLLNNLVLSFRTNTPLVQLYSYSRSDYDIDLYMSILKGEKRSVVDEYYAQNYYIP